MEVERRERGERESEREISKHTTANSPLGIIHTCSHIQSQAHFVLAEFCACHQQLAFRRVALFLCSFFFLLLTQSCRSETRWGRKTSAPSLHTQARKKDGKEEVAKRHRARHNTAASGKRFRNSTETCYGATACASHKTQLLSTVFQEGKKGGIRKRKKQGKNKKERRRRSERT